MPTLYCLIDDKAKISGARTYNKKDEKLFKEMNEQGWGVYFSVNEFNNSRKEDDCSKLRYVYADLDIAKKGDGQTRESKTIKKEKLYKALIEKCEPTLIIDTSNGLQPLWEITDFEPTEENKLFYKQVLKGIVKWSKTVGSFGDNVYDVSRILRLVGYYHQKEEPYLCDFIHKSNKKYSLFELSLLFPYEEETKIENNKISDNSNPVFNEIEKLDFKELVMKAFASVGRPVTFDKSGHLIDPVGGTTGTFLGRKGNRDYLASSSHEPFQGNRITAIAEILKVDYSDAYKWICKEYNLDFKKLIKLEKKNIVTEQKKDVEFLTLGEVVELGYRELTQTKSEEVISYGYSWLDDKLVGIFPSELIVLGGESGTGKTALATNIIYKASKKVKCGVYALEDRLTDYGIRALYYQINKIKKLNEGHDAKNYWWNDYRLNRITSSSFITYLEQAKKQLQNENVHFAKIKAMMTIDLLESLIQEQVNNGVKLFLVDHLHYFDMSSKEDSKSDYVESIMVRLKTMLNKTGASMILVVHYKKLEGKKPSIDSFKDSVAIPQNANYVINLWRERSSDKSDEIEQLGESKIPVLKKYITHFMIPKVRNPNGEGTCKAVWNCDKGDYEDEKYDWKSGTELQQIAKDFGGKLIDDIKF